MLRLTKKADYGLMALKYLAEQPDAVAGIGSARSAKDIAEAYHIPPPLLAKILQTLAKAGLLVSHAGTNGGYALARSAKEISAFEVIRAIDGPLFIHKLHYDPWNVRPCRTLHHQRTSAQGERQHQGPAERDPHQRPSPRWTMGATTKTARRSGAVWSAFWFRAEI